MRPELRMGFPVWVPKYDSFFYVQAISHNFSIGGQATTTLTLTAKRSKFIAPKNIGKITRNKERSETVKDQERDNKGKIVKTTVRTLNVNSYKIEFPDDAGKSTFINDPDPQKAKLSEGAIIRDPKTGKLLGFPNAVMVFRTALNGEKLTNIETASGRSISHNPAQQTKVKNAQQGLNYPNVIKDTLSTVQLGDKQDIINRLRSHRYEAAMSNIGAYDYAWDTKGDFKDITIVPTDSITWGEGTTPPDEESPGAVTIDNAKERQAAIDADVKKVEEELKLDQVLFNEANKILKAAQDKANKDKSTEASKALEIAAANVKTASDDLNAVRIKLAATKKGLGKIKKLPKLSVMVRPVSDEFGFEVIGHYRYGRGAFIDLGKIQVRSDNNKIANQLGIQFAQTGGFLQGSLDVTKGTQGPQLQFLSETFDRMQPNDYETGASFSGMRPGDKDTAEEINFTSQQTYAENIAQQKGKQVFIEADATSRSKTLEELSPTLTIGSLSDATVECNCMLGKTNWLSILPQDLLSRIIQGNNPISVGRTKDIPDTEASATIKQGIVDSIGGSSVASDIIASSEANSGVEIDPDPAAKVSFQNPGGFFTILNNYLTDMINTNYETNAKREQRDVKGERPAFAPPRDTTNNILPDPTNPIFARAAQGDPDAIKALQNDVNFNFGLTKQGLENFKGGVANAGAKLSESLADLTSGSTKSVFSVTTDTPSQQALKDAQNQLNGANAQLNRANQILAANPNSANARNAVNDAKNNVSALQNQVNTLQNAVNTGVSPPQYQPVANPPMVGDILNPTKFSAATGDIYVPKS
jgi:hypothetical protein